MQLNPISNGPDFAGGYMPYFYQSGKFLNYDQPQQIEHGLSRQMKSDGAIPSGHSSYDFSSDLSSEPTFRKPQTVEQIIAHGYFAIPDGEPETAIISDKKQTSWLGLEDTIRQVRNRHDLYHRNMYELHQGVCEADNAIFRQVAAQGAPADNRQQYSASKLTQELYEQMRLERVTLWKDISRLKQSLPEVAQNYLAAYRKVAILEDDGGDAF